MKIGVGIIGAGTVGGGVIETLVNNGPLMAARSGVTLKLAHVADLALESAPGLEMSGATTSNDARQLIADPEVGIVCELIGGREPAKAFILEAMKAGKHVVTANKMLVAHDGVELCRAAHEYGVELRYEAAVAGGIPIIKALREGLAANRVRGVYGILNGTCNYILSRMTYEGREFNDVLRQAQDLGFAETPPDLDVDGLDTAHKCQILASLAFSTKVDIDAIHVEGVRTVTAEDVAYAREMGFLIKLLAVIRDGDGGIEARVHPTLVPETHLLASVRNEFNAVYVEADTAGPTLYYGKGAGRFPTASAVVADIVDIALRWDEPAAPPFVYGERQPLRDIGETRCPFYLRLKAIDRPGVLGDVCAMLGGRGVSIASVMQKAEHEAEQPVDVVLMTHETEERSLRAAVEQIDALECVTEPTRVLRVLEE